MEEAARFPVRRCSGWTPLVLGAGIVLLAALFVPFPLAAQEASPAPDGYRIGGGDRLQLVVWREPRSSGAIYGARLSVTGTLLDPLGFAISNAGNDEAPAVAWGGGNYLVAWRDYSRGLFASRVSGSGAVLDPGGIAVSTASLRAR